MKALLVSFLFLINLAGCNNDDNNDAPASENQERQLSAEEIRIVSLKAHIRQITAQATERFDVDDGRPEIAQQLEPLIHELESLNPRRSVEETQEVLLGSWHQIWSDLALGPPGAGPLADFVYQIILPDTVLWNIALVENGPIRRTELLRANYLISDESFDFTYSRAVFISQWLPLGTDLGPLGAQAESGKFDVNRILYEQGQGPIGRKATLRPIYMDSDFRISRGGSEDVGMNHIFIFEKTDKINAP